ncbi:MAG: DNA translocase FtsK 4TM domain-containing protein [Syntrophaceae bacterium]|nr:DNA translocase FtsK 4TM domain-containing protein [Syntrophaceae bacterium]
MKRTREIKGVTAISLALFFLLCLFSYSPLDPSFTHYVSDQSKVHNLIGPIGSYTADSLIRLLGGSVFYLPLFLAIAGFRYLVTESFRLKALHFLGFTGLVLSTSVVLAMVMKDVSLSGVILRPGGVVGLFVFHILDTRLNTTGTALVSLSVLLVSLMVMTNFSILFTARILSRITLFSWLRTHVFFAGLRERLPFNKVADKKEKGRTPRIIPEVDDIPPDPPKEAPRKAEQVPFDFILKRGVFRLPSLTLLSDMPHKDTRVKKETLIANSRILEKKLADFGVEGRVVEVRPGPVITMYELEPAPGVKITKITTLSDDLALALRAPSIRIIAPIPGKAVVGIEIPNPEREAVSLKDVLDNAQFADNTCRLPIALGKDIVGAPVIADLIKMPHLLIAGTTGSGKSVSLNAMICSILFKLPPDEAKFLMIDPKRLELAAYEGIPHLLHPVVVDPKKASQVLKWAVAEMERRYQLISTLGAKSIDMFNKILERRAAETADHEQPEPPEPVAAAGDETAIEEDEEETLLPVAPGSEASSLPLQKLPYIIIVIDELADLMMVAQRNVEESLARLAQMARAAGIHLILATQRPSVDVITGLIKANFRTRISFQVSSKVDSRTILDDHGAEKLLGAGDMLFIPPGTSRLNRIHGAFVSDKEINRVVEFVKKQAKPVYDESITAELPDEEGREHGESEFDEKYDEAVELVTDLGQASISLVQRYMKIGYNRAARIIEQMEAEGIVGPSDGVKPRKVLARKIPK